MSDFLFSDIRSRQMRRHTGLEFHSRPAFGYRQSSNGDGHFETVFRMFRNLFLLLPLIAFAGQSLRTTGTQAANDAFPARPHNVPWRVEFYLHDWSDTAPTARYAVSEAIGINFVLYNQGNGDIRIGMYGTWDPGVNHCFVLLKDLTVRAVYVRFQRDPEGSVERCEAWDKDGRRIQSSINAWNGDTGARGNGIQVGAGGASTAFFRVHSTLVPMNSRPPVTADNSGVLLHWKFDGNLRDSGPSGYNAILQAPPEYVETPNQNVVAKIKTADAPIWNDWTSLRAGYPARLDGTASFSQSDSSAAVTYAWEEVPDSGARRPPLIWDNSSAAQPSVTGAVFGNYTFQLTVKDVNNNTASTTLDIGAVATDDNGVVIHAGPNAEKIFGPMIAFGKNPWGYMDERAISATRLRAAAYRKLGLDPPSWTVPQTGSVTYVFNGAGYAGAPGTSLCEPIQSAAAMTVTVCDASKFDLSTLPTRILVGQDWARREEIRICGADGNTLTVCYDGRGINPGAGPDTYRTAAQAWPKDTHAGQMKITGTDTEFLSTICPAGPGPSGTVKYAEGSVALRPGLANILGNGTRWSVQNGVIPGYSIRVAATHGGTPFVFWAYIVSVGGEGSMTLSRPYPADADDGTFAYQVLAADVRQPVLHYSRPDGSDAMIGFATDGCESNTEMYAYSAHEVPGVNGTLQSNKQYSYVEFPGYAGAFGVNFYGEDLAHRALYMRSGWKPARDAANQMSDQFVTSPFLAGGDAGGIPLLYGGGVVGAVASMVLDPTTKLHWSDLRGFFKTGARSAGIGCNDADTRDSSYVLMFLALGAEFDPDPVQRANWLTALRQAGARDLKCQGADNSWANGFLFNPGTYPPLRVTNGSATATGTNLPSTICTGFGAGSLTVTRDSAEVTSGGGFVAGSKISITGTKDGAPFTAYYQYRVDSPRSITLGALWPGDSGAATYVLERNSALGSDGDWLTTIGTSVNDPQLRKNWSCIWNGPNQITLNRPWDGPDGTVYLYKGVLAGFGQQPYMVGMKTIQMKFAAQAGDPDLASSYMAMSAAAAGWVHDNGFDPATLGLHYGRVYQACEPVPKPPDTPQFASRTPGCNFGLEPSSIRAARVLTAEATNALRAYYEANPADEARDWGDQAYGAVWGYGPYTNPGVYSDDYYVKDENSDLSLGAYKWTGFFFGMGMSHQWPAVRLGGAQPPANVNLTVKLNLAGAASASIRVTAPSGAQRDFPCSGAACQITIDKRQGSHWYQVTYLSSSGAALKQDAPQLISAPGTPTRR